MEKVYLGDSVYCEFDRGVLKLTTEQGDNIASNTIFFELSVYKALVNYMTKLCEENNEQS